MNGKIALRGSSYEAGTANPEYQDPTTGEMDKEDFFDDKGEAFDVLPGWLRKTMAKDTKGVDPLVRQYEPDYREARRLRSVAYDYPHWTGIDSEKEEQIEDLQLLVAQYRARLGLSGPVAIQQYNTVAAENGITDGVITLAHYLRPGSSGDKGRQDPRRIKFLIANGEELAPYFPDLYRSRSLQATLSDEVREEVILTAVGR